MVRSELWTEREDIRVAVKSGREGMVNWRVDEGSHVMDMRGKNEAGGGGISLLSWRADRKIQNVSVESEMPRSM